MEHEKTLRQNHPMRTAWCFLFLCTLPLAAQESLPTSIPKDLSASELLDFARTAIRDRPLPPNLTQAETLRQIVRRSELLLEVAEAALEQKPEGELLARACMLKFEGLQHLARTNDPKRVEALENWLDEMDRRLPNSREGKMARSVDLQRQVGVFVKLKPNEEEFQRIRKNVLELILREPVGYPPGLPMNLIEIASVAEQKLRRTDLVESTGRELLDVLKSSGNLLLQDAVKRVEAATHTVGMEFVLEGMTLDDRKFDIRTLQGKVVLVDFFTSWCIPCIEEFPRLKTLYEKYRDRGFEIVGIGMDDEKKIRKIVEKYKLPWPVVSEEATLRRNMPGIDARYKLRRYPTVFLIDREGKLIDADARGAKLEKTLESILD